MPNKYQIEIGDILWWYGKSREPVAVITSKVGRKWLTIGVYPFDQRFDLTNLDDDGAWAEDFSGRLFRSPDAFHAAERVMLGQAWDSFRFSVSKMYVMPEGMDINWINEAKLHLGIID